MAGLRVASAPEEPPRRVLSAAEQGLLWCALVPESSMARGCRLCAAANQLQALPPEGLPR